MRLSPTIRFLGSPALLKNLTPRPDLTNFLTPRPPLSQKTTKNPAFRKSSK